MKMDPLLGMAIGEQDKSDDDFACAAAVGSLGLFGNSIIQLIACKILADRAGLRLVLPKHWAIKYGGYFPALDSLEHMDAKRVYSLPLVADRVVLSHPGWRPWALRHETGRQLAARLGSGAAPKNGHVKLYGGGQGADEGAPDAARKGVVANGVAVAAAAAAAAAFAGTDDAQRGGHAGGACEAVARLGAAAVAASAASLAAASDTLMSPQLSGRQLRAHFPQLSGNDLAAEPKELAARLRGRGLWGYFQFPASCFAPYRESVRHLLTLRADLREELLGALDVVLSAHPPAYGKARRDDCGGGAAAAAAAAGAPLGCCDSSRSNGANARRGDGVGGKRGKDEHSGDDDGSGGGRAATGADAPTGGRAYACRTAADAAGRGLRRLVVLHLRRGDFRELPLPPPPLPLRPEPAIWTGRPVPHGRLSGDGSGGDIGREGGKPPARCQAYGPAACSADASSMAPTEARAHALPAVDKHLSGRYILQPQSQSRDDLASDQSGGQGSGGKGKEGGEAAESPELRPPEDRGGARKRVLGGGGNSPTPLPPQRRSPSQHVATAPPAPPPCHQLREWPPFEDDGVQGGAWCDRSGVDFRTPLEMYGVALAALPYDPDADLLWVCSDDAKLARRAEVCGWRGTSWAAAAGSVAAASASTATALRNREPSDGGGGGVGLEPVAVVSARLRRVGVEEPPYSTTHEAVNTLRRASSGDGSGDGGGQMLAAALREDAGAANDGAAGTTNAAAAAAAVAPPPPPRLSPEQVALLERHAVLADWFVMQRADVLLTSNSTFSFTAAMLNPAAASSGDGAPTAAAVAAPLLLRPDPTLGAFRRFDPWAELPLLPSLPVPRNHSLVAMAMAQARPQAGTARGS